MKIKATTLLLLSTIMIASTLFTACSGSHPVAAGAAGAAAYDKHQENQRQDDINKAKDARNR